LFFASAHIKKDTGPLLDSRKIVLEMSEHDVSRLLVLIYEEVSQGEKAWEGYWLRMARKIEQSVERSGLTNTSNNKPD
jgi:hypothetical protein